MLTRYSNKIIKDLKNPSENCNLTLLAPLVCPKFAVQIQWIELFWISELQNKKFYKMTWTNLNYSEVNLYLPNHLYLNTLLLQKFFYSLLENRRRIEMNLVFTVSFPKWWFGGYVPLNFRVTACMHLSVVCLYHCKYILSSRAYCI